MSASQTSALMTGELSAAERPSQRMKRLRRLAGLTQFQLARLSGLRIDQVSRYESEYRTLEPHEITLLERICKSQVEQNLKAVRHAVREK